MPDKKPKPKSASKQELELDRLLPNPHANETPEEWLRRTEREKREDKRLNEYVTGGGTRGFSSGLYGAPQGPETEFIQGRENTLNALYAMLTGKGAAPRGYAANLNKYVRGK